MWLRWSYFHLPVQGWVLIYHHYNSTPLVCDWFTELSQSVLYSSGTCYWSRGGHVTGDDHYCPLKRSLIHSMGAGLKRVFPVSTFHEQESIIFCCCRYPIRREASLMEQNKTDTQRKAAQLSQSSDQTKVSPASGLAGMWEDDPFPYYLSNFKNFKNSQLRVS